ncbi:MAG: hypothetical protein A2W90_09420 [Bacteroidetes bacterium GWF2_42_66]|nr:MAG: hypothetical protein A2W92_00110 [Bacteroidetes bacterium GWA2_42_15]OFY01727.1 MAG: hypothetical protein A2W89_22625 [Bacteroidetes bacterium GWE2_42_39]OFY46474.1 MAG: hypothetical protein A2W90_09420 [Bacteroidetes bacterium GWF2_42_66]HAZ02941.1 hypothetical protein [Marinilabiliales bacterium]HBL76120.1 hypothetical protein [Prolixibacteraceae bacterium]
MDYPEIKKYLEGKTHGNQSEQIRNWLINPDNEDQVRKVLGEIWANSRISLTGNKPDFDVLLKKVHYRLNQQSSRKETPVKTIYRLFTKVAAILLLPLLILTAYLYLDPSTGAKVSGEVSVRETYTKPGTRTKIELPDGTLVWLNDGTTIKYPEYFKGNDRQVFVDGEAYFEVKSNPEKPFIVNNPIMTTVVTGTHFNLYAYSSDNFFEATLLEGKIRLEGQAGKIDLIPGQRIQFDAVNKKFTRDEIHPENAIAWINGKLVMRNERLESAIKKLSRWYNVEISVSDSLLNAYELTCTLENEKIGQCMNLISQALPITYTLKEEKENDKIQQKIQLMKK